MDNNESIKRGITLAMMENDIVTTAHLWQRLPRVQRSDPYYTVMAISAGDINILDYVHRNGGKWNEGTCVLAARLGKLGVLKHLRSSGCPWDHRTAFCAVEFGQLEILEWALNNGCTCDKYELLNYAAFYGQAKIVSWLLQNYTCYTPRALEIAHLRGDNFLFDYLAEHVIRNY